MEMHNVTLEIGKGFDFTVESYFFFHRKCEGLEGVFSSLCIRQERPEVDKVVIGVEG